MSNTISHDSETPAPMQQVITTCAFLHHQFNGIEKVFLPRRADTKRFLPGVYELPGGHIEYGEDLVVGLKREILEEFGMRIAVGDPFFAFTYLNEIKGSHSVEIIYFARFVDPVERIRLNPEDHSTCGWFGEGELLEVTSEKKADGDPEIRAIRRGFELLKGGELAY